MATPKPCRWYTYLPTELKRPVETFAQNERRSIANAVEFIARAGLDAINERRVSR